MNTVMMSSLLAAILIAASVPVTAAERGRSGASGASGASQRQQPQQQRVQPGAQQGNSARGDARQFQGQARDAGREQHASRSADRSNPSERQHAQRNHERQSRDVHGERNDGQRRFGHDGSRDHAGSGSNRGGQGNHYGWQNGRSGGQGNHYGWQNGRSGGQGNHYGWQGNHNGGQSPTRAFDRRYDHAQQDQRQDIRQGIRSGELTRQEAGRLTSEQRRLEAQERRYMADGRLSSRERADMTQDLNRARQHIYNETHDAQERR